MKKPTFDEVVAGLELEEPKGPILKSYASLTAFEAVEMIEAMKECNEGGSPYELIMFFASVLPVDKKSRKKMGKMTLKEIHPVIMEWLKENS